MISTKETEKITTCTGGHKFRYLIDSFSSNAHEINRRTKMEKNVKLENRKEKRSQVQSIATLRS